jgi:hypothetical protein
MPCIHPFNFANFQPGSSKGGLLKLAALLIDFEERRFLPSLWIFFFSTLLPGYFWKQTFSWGDTTPIFLLSSQFVSAL